ncbi:MAG: hypothetical protein MJZ22_06210, partial [Candidatus Saccharibacteria bacterium]|nr:hypothetical protein [Candidatus Saccharibacteria bacterium]
IVILMKNLKLISVLALSLTLAFVSCKKDNPAESSFDKVAAAKAALRTDGQAIDKVLKENGYSSTQFDDKYHRYIKGDDACMVLLNKNIVTGVQFCFVKDNFDAVKAEFASNEAACAKAYPDNFSASIESPNLNAEYTRDNEEPAFLRDGQSLTADIKEFECRAESFGVGGAEWREWRELLFSKEDGNQEWQCAIAVQFREDD